MVEECDVRVCAFLAGARVGTWSAWQAARVEVTPQQEAAEREAHPIEEKVVERIVAKTNVQREIDLA